MPSTESAAAALELGPPARVAVGKGSAFVVAGYCYHPTESTHRLDIRLGEARQPVERFGLPRKDVYDRLEAGDPARERAFKSGFVAIPALTPVDHSSELELDAVMTLSSGRELSVPLGSLAVDPGILPPHEATGAAFPEHPCPRVAICMATYEPPGDLLRVQLDSIKEQTHGNWICLISDDGSSEEALSTLRALTNQDPRFVVSHSPDRLGFIGTSKGPCRWPPRSADFVTLSDQDDRWHPGKLERLLGGIGDAHSPTATPGSSRPRVS